MTIDAIPCVSISSPKHNMHSLMCDSSSTKISASLAVSAFTVRIFASALLMLPSMPCGRSASRLTPPMERVCPGRRRRADLVSVSADPTRRDVCVCVPPPCWAGCLPYGILLANARVWMWCILITTYFARTSYTAQCRGYHQSVGTSWRLYVSCALLHFVAPIWPLTGCGWTAAFFPLPSRGDLTDC